MFEFARCNHATAYCRCPIAPPHAEKGRLILPQSARRPCLKKSTSRLLSRAFYFVSCPMRLVSLHIYIRAQMGCGNGRFKKLRSVTFSSSPICPPRTISGDERTTQTPTLLASLVRLTERSRGTIRRRSDEAILIKRQSIEFDRERRRLNERPRGWRSAPAGKTV